MNGAAARSYARIEWSEWSEISRWRREASRNEECIGESLSRAEREGIVKRIWVTKKRVKEFERVGKCVDMGAERVTSGIILGVAGWVFGRGWPDTMAVVR